MSFDLAELTALDPAARLARVKDLLAAAQSFEVASPKRNRAADRVALANAVNPLGGREYAGIVIYNGSTYFELRHDDGQKTIHFKKRFDSNYSRRLRVKPGDQILIHYRVRHGAHLDWRPRCICRANWVGQFDLFCPSCQAICQWCTAPATTIFCSFPACDGCLPSLDADRATFLRLDRPYYGPDNCVWCAERTAKTTVIKNILATYPMHIRVCRECLPHINAFTPPLLHAHKRSSRDYALAYGACERCRHGRVWWFIETTDEGNRYVCRQCVRIAPKHTLSKTPTLEWGGTILPYDDEPVKGEMDHA